ncbi:GNAT family N-acetyltransferase [Myxococcaceae bacterium GXIMD 01537]
MSATRFVVVEGAGIAPYVPGLRRLEGSIQYPLADGEEHFTIDHGEHYHPFFSMMGQAYFLLALRGDEVVGSLAGVVRTARVAGRELRTLYLCDLKVAREERGRGLARRMLQSGLGELLRRPELRACRMLYGAAMRGERGDVMRSARGFNPLRLGRPDARLALFFVSSDWLMSLDVSGAPRPPSSPGLELGPSPLAPLDAPGVCTTAGRKDLRLVSTGKPWPLAHLPLGPSAWGESWGAYLRDCGKALGRYVTTCFAIDDRLTDHLAWLAGLGVRPDTVCTVYSLALPFTRGRVDWVHLPTSEI